MPTSHRIAGAFLAATTMLLIAPHLAQAQDADAQEVLRYTLTEAGLAKYSQATKQLAALPDQERACDEEDTEAKSLDEMAAKLDGVPGARAAIQSAGMTSREYMVFSLSLLQNGMAAWAVSQPTSTGAATTRTSVRASMDRGTRPSARGGWFFKIASSRAFKSALVMPLA